MNSDFSMGFSTKILFFVLWVFCINMFFYFASSDYRHVLRVLKQDFVETEANISPEFDALLENAHIVYTSPTSLQESLPLDSFPSDFLLEEWEEEAENGENMRDTWEVIGRKEIVLWRKYQDIIWVFSSYYDLQKIEFNSSLFELTTEYPDYFYEYYHRDVTLYLFPTRTYEQIFYIFEYLSMSLPFSLNEVNNFWTASFYINMEEDVDDGFVRVVVSLDGITFWLKIKKDEYNRVKEILLSF